MSGPKQHRSLVDLTLVTLLFLCLSVVLWRACTELPYREDFLQERIIWNCLFSISYGAFLIAFAMAFSEVISRFAVFRLRFVVFGATWGVIPTLLLWYLLAEVGIVFDWFRALLITAFELSAFLGKSLMLLAGRPSALWNDHFLPEYEQEQFLIFLPLNVLGWITLSEALALLWRRPLRRMPRTEAVLLVGATVAFCCGLLAFLGSWELAVTVDLVLQLPQAVIAGLSLGLFEVKGPGILPASIYFSMCVLMLFLVLRRRLVRRRSSESCSSIK